VKAIGRKVLNGVQGDVAKWAILIVSLRDHHGKGRIDVVLLNAGIVNFLPWRAFTEEPFDNLFNINEKGTLIHGCKTHYRLPNLMAALSISHRIHRRCQRALPLGVCGATKVPLRNFVRAWTVN